MRGSMDNLIYLKALIMGLVEGLTEFLPVSSTGHLIIAGDLLNFNDNVGKVFEIVIQLGAILAVVWEFRARIGTVVRGLGHDPVSRRFAANIMIAFLPAAIFGLLFIKAIKAHMFTPFWVGVFFILGGFVIFAVERYARNPRIHHVDDMTWKDALKVGFAQAFSIVPGTSRSGATIMGGMIFGLSRQAATEFSFFLAIPTMFAATFYELAKHWHELHAHDFVVFGIGFATAFVSAFFAVRALLRYISSHSFAIFAWYRIVFGVVLLIYFRDTLFTSAG